MRFLYLRRLRIHKFIHTCAVFLFVIRYVDTLGSSLFPPHQPLTPSEPSSAPTLVPFYLRRVSTPSASSPSRTPPPTPPPIVARQYHGGSYGINKSGAHAPQLPSLLPSLAPLILHTPNSLYMCKHPHLSDHTPPASLSSHPASNRANFPRIHPLRNYL